MITQQSNICSKSAIETLEKDVVLVSLLLNFNIFHTFLKCFYCWIWTSKCLLGIFFLRNVHRVSVVFYCVSILLWHRVAVSHYVKSVHIWSFSGPYFPAFELNTEIFRVNLCIQSKCGKIHTRETPNTYTFCAVSMT